MSDQRFVYVTYIAATAQQVWDALLKGELTRQYWGYENVSDWRPGSKWQHVADDGKRTVKLVGEVLESVPNKRLVMTWGEAVAAADKAKRSRVAIDIETVGEMVRLTVTHDELTPQMRQEIANGWPRVLSSLKSFLETGRPLNTWA
ncbi:MAG TPA: SRPBCC family protein [Steroidobacteraceae bacterium]|jgi:uncharacterized protein YndB with AHSA1/START domain|nr:SRPBCC family protein [Steroidobacteraceae bacterium]